MFSGIVEDAIEVVGLRHDESNLHITLRCPFADELRIDQSISHNGVCLTVVSLPGDGTYTVTAIRETLDRSNLGGLKVGDLVNVERSMKSMVALTVTSCRVMLTPLPCVKEWKKPTEAGTTLSNMTLTANLQRKDMSR